MRVPFTTLFVFFAVQATAFACEGECIVRITNAFIHKYQVPINDTLTDIATELVTLVGPHAGVRHASYYVAPILTAYKDTAYDSLENAIFPSYFHGKCQRDGVNPPGCPNPDCPVVCGTPGSLVHFYSKLGSIVFENTKSRLMDSAKPDSDAYKKMKRMVLDDAKRGSKRMIRIRKGSMRVQKRGDIESRFEAIMKKIGSVLESKCSGDKQGNLEHCSWEKEMKSFILTFP